MKYRWLVGVVLLLPATASAQGERFELGLRLREFERAWDAVPDAASRKRAVTPLNGAVRSFFTGNVGGVGEALDRARHALRSAEAAPPEVRWADTLSADPEARLVDAARPELLVGVRALYKVDVPLPSGAKARLRLGDGKPVEVALDGLPASSRVPWVGLSPGDTPLHFDVLVEGRVLRSATFTVSVVKDLKTRLAALEKAAEAIGAADSVERATLPHLVAILKVLADRRPLETAYPAARLLDEAEAVARAASEGQSYYGAARSGQFWLRVPSGKSSEAVRIFVPEKADPAKLLPVVFALHGAGGSENLFFDGYGDGITAKVCRERGWFMVATQAGGGLGFGGPPGVPALLDALARRYPIDGKRVYLVGHSMGAGHAVALAQQDPGRYAGAAALGGGGGLRRPEALKDLPFFVGCGKADFALRGSRALADSLRKGGVTRTHFKEYDDVEHMMIVREAIPDVFRFWDGK